jgi:hypothetical protein
MKGNIMKKPYRVSYTFAKTRVKTEQMTALELRDLLEAGGKIVQLRSVYENVIS